MKKTLSVKNLILLLLFLAGLIYLILPGPTSISGIPALPNSRKSTEPGDTYQNPNNAAYFSSHYRKFVTDFYKESFENLNVFGKFIPAIRLNHPPETAFQYIRDQQASTYLEEYLYPMRDSLFVNGYEPFDQMGRPFYKGITQIIVDGQYFDTKTTLRIYHSNLIYRVAVYTGIWILAIWLYTLWIRTIKEK